jgi:hypothetical protein
MDASSFKCLIRAQNLNQNPKQNIYDYKHLSDYLYYRGHHPGSRNLPALTLNYMDQTGADRISYYQIFYSNILGMLSILFSVSMSLILVSNILNYSRDTYIMLRYP